VPVIAGAWIATRRDGLANYLACRDATARPAFVKAYEDLKLHLAAAA
jgi:hypothetical protein